MAKVLYEYLQRKKSESGATGNVTYDLPEGGFMPELTLRVFATPTASTDPALPTSEAITKIELIDGGKTIKSFTGNQAHGFSMIHRRPARASTETNDNAVEGYDDFLIVLGKKVNGVDYAPDMSRFANPQIKVSWDFSLTTGARGATYDADSAPAMKFTVFAKIVRESNKYTHGYIKTNEIKTYTQATSTEEQTEIPRGEMLLGLAIEAGYVNLDWTEDVEELELNFDNSNWIPLKLFEEEIEKFQEEVFKDPFELSFAMDLIDGVEVDLHMGFVRSYSVKSSEFTSLTSVKFASIPKGVVGAAVIRTSVEAVDATYRQHHIKVTGLAPYGLYYIPMKALLDGSGDLVDTSRHERIVLKLKSGSSASTSNTPSVLAEWLVTN